MTPIPAVTECVLTGSRRNQFVGSTIASRAARGGPCRGSAERPVCALDASACRLPKVRGDRSISLRIITGDRARLAPHCGPYLVLDNPKRSRLGKPESGCGGIGPHRSGVEVHPEQTTALFEPVRARRRVHIQRKSSPGSLNRYQKSTRTVPASLGVTHHSPSNPSRSSANSSPIALGERSVRKTSQASRSQ